MSRVRHYSDVLQHLPKGNDHKTQVEPQTSHLWPGLLPPGLCPYSALELNWLPSCHHECSNVTVLKSTPRPLLGVSHSLTFFTVFHMLTSAYCLLHPQHRNSSRVRSTHIFSSQSASPELCLAPLCDTAHVHTCSMLNDQPN